MKKAITFRWLAAFFAAIFIYASNSAMAQIKVVGDDYSTALTSSKSYYDCDVDFEKYFPSASPIERFSKIYPFLGDNALVNLTNDTVYICEDHSLGCATSSFVIINNKVEDFSTCSFGKLTIPSGYYIISGYVFCKDNEDSIRAAAGLECREYYAGRSNDPYTIQKLKEKILIKGERFSSGDLVWYERYIMLTALDNSAVYYINANSEGRADSFEYLLLRYYNEIKAFVGKTVVLKTRSLSRRIMEKIKDPIIKDGISGNVVKLEDEKYEVIDVVLKDCGVFIVLKGDATGTFSFKTNSVYYAYSTDQAIAAECPNCYGWNVKEFDNTMDVPLIRVSYNNKLVSNDYIALIVEEKNWNTLEQRAKKTQEQQEKERKLQQQREQQEKAKKDAAFKQQMIAKHGSQFGELVANKQVAIGMTKDMCRDAWGRPINTYRTTTRLTTEEVWCYNYKTRIYFVNDKVVRIEN